MQFAGNDQSENLLQHGFVQLGIPARPRTPVNSDDPAVS